MTTKVTIKAAQHAVKVLTIPHAEGKPNCITGEPTEVAVPKEATHVTYAHGTQKIEVHEDPMPPTT